MKSGEILLNINKKDIKALFINTLGFEYNNLCPFAEVLKDDVNQNSDVNPVNTVAKNQDAVYLLSNLAKPLSLLQFRLGGPKEKYKKLSISKIDNNKFILVIFDGDSYGIQYYDDKLFLSEILDSLVINSDAEEGSSFPDELNFESLVMYLGIIDSLRYIKYRDTLNHHFSTLNKISSDEFQKVVKDSIEKFDANWVLSNLMFLLPSVTKFELKSNPDVYDKLFNNGYLLSVKDNKTNENLLLLDVKSSELGGEFLELWYKSAGIQISNLKDGDVETHPAAFIAVTSIANHTFLFEENTDKIKYRNYLPIVTPNIFIPIIDKLIYINPVQETKEEFMPRFCGKCGTKITEGAKFCGKCGNIIN